MTHSPSYRDETDVQFTRMLHAETQRQLSRVTETLTDIETRLRQLEHLRDYREGQVSISTGLSGAAFKVGLVVLAFALGIWGASAWPPPCDRQRELEPPSEIYEPHVRRPLKDFNNDQSN